jgi:hypothetical protein
MKKPNNIKEVMSWVGSHTSEKKAIASRKNGCLGGRPLKKPMKILRAKT